MRQFVVVAHDAPTEPEFSLDDLPGAGRLDLLARAVADALLVSHDIRTDSRVHAVLDDTFTVTVDGATVRNLRPDERSTAALLRTALKARDEAVGAMAADAAPGVSIRRFGLAPLLDAVDGTVVELHAAGDPIDAASLPDDPVFVLSDHTEFDDADRTVLDERATRRVSLGPTALHADQAITVVHNHLDTR
ncbi:tRNA (pseudouridine(54)-N(1))-methyltransferase TrmY [Halobacteriales archaeon SW_7_68_16]|nr:MAG: tRNA (pseudouridine(54)-N(1))-methyltransferase TrmY [Halobacteriales archaeon SW_7_68_16]